MEYTPPTSTNVDFELIAYTEPDYNEVDFELQDEFKEVKRPRTMWFN